MLVVFIVIGLCVPLTPLVPLIPGGPCGPGTVLFAPAGPVWLSLLLSFLSLSLSNLTCLQNSTELTKKPSNGSVLH